MTEKDRDKLGLPVREFFYTPDQVAFMFDVEVDYLLRTMVYFEGRTPGVRPRDKLHAINLTPLDAAKQGVAPVWRISERSLVGYFKVKGIKYYTRTL